MTRLASATLRDLGIDQDGNPTTPLEIVELDGYLEAGREVVRSAAEELAHTSRVTVGVVRSASVRELAPLLAAVTCSIGPAGEATQQRVVPVPDVDAAITRLREAVTARPRAAVVLAALLRQSVQLDPYAGLAAEAASYSTLLGGPEFAGWLQGRRRRADATDDDGRRLRVTRTDTSLAVVLDFDERRNALDARMREDLYQALLVAVVDDAIVRVDLSAEGETFCSGGDLQEFGRAPDPATAFLVRLDRAPWRLLEAIRERVHVFIDGAAIGAGVEIAAFAGSITATPRAFFALPEVGMGLLPGAGGTVSIPRRIGRWRAAWLMLTGERIDAATARDWGLIDQIVAHD